MKSLSLDKDKIRILLLEGVHQKAVETFELNGYRNIEYLKGSLVDEQLRRAVRDAHLVGIRSRTHIDESVLAAASKLIAVGCFCIGTNQVDLEAAQRRGVPVFNAPFSNTRSVAELVLAEIVMLMRGIPQKNAAAHRGAWQKSAKNAYEVRGKTLGIIGYGHIGTQLGVIAEHLGMRVIFHDIEQKLPLGNARQCEGLDELLRQSHVVSLHVPATPLTENMINAATLSRMPRGSFLVNASRGNVVDIDALSQALETEHLLGAAIDVFPIEPKTGDELFESRLRAFDNVLLTPHIGGSTLEAQQNIGLEVANKLLTYSDNGSTVSAVNFPEVALPEQEGFSRLLHIHENIPGVLRRINDVFADHGINIAAQYLQTKGEVGYVVMDVDTDDADVALSKLREIPHTIRTRVLH